MVSRSYSNLLELASGESPSFERMNRRIPRIMTVAGIMSDIDDDPSESVCSDPSSSSGQMYRIIIVANQLPIRAQRKSHCLHRQLQICKYVYHDVVRLQEIQKHLDCSKIQTYKINGEKAIHLKPRPQPKDARPSTKAKFGASCEACARYLQDVPNRFCSIACKVSAVSVELKDQSHEIISLSIQEFTSLSWKENPNAEKHSSENESSLSLTDMSEDTQGWMNSALKPRRQLHKRKGVPRRAPLC